MGGRFLFAGVGNIAGDPLLGRQPHHLLSMEGIVGHDMRKVRMVERGWSPGDTLVLGPTACPGAGTWPATRPAAAACAAGRVRPVPRLRAATDDATVVVARDLR